MDFGERSSARDILLGLSIKCESGPKGAWRRMRVERLFHACWFSSVSPVGRQACLIMVKGSLYFIAPMCPIIFLLFSKSSSVLGGRATVAEWTQRPMCPWETELPSLPPPHAGLSLSVPTYRLGVILPPSACLRVWIHEV